MENVSKQNLIQKLDEIVKDLKKTNDTFKSIKNEMKKFSSQEIHSYTLQVMDDFILGCEDLKKELLMDKTMLIAEIDHLRNKINKKDINSFVFIRSMINQINYVNDQIESHMEEQK